MAGIWKHSDIFVMSGEALCDAHELLDLKEENEFRYHEWKGNNRVE